MCRRPDISSSSRLSLQSSSVPLPPLVNAGSSPQVALCESVSITAAYVNEVVRCRFAVEMPSVGVFACIWLASKNALPAHLTRANSGHVLRQLQSYTGTRRGLRPETSAIVQTSSRDEDDRHLRARESHVDAGMVGGESKTARSGRRTDRNQVFLAPPLRWALRPQLSGEQWVAIPLSPQWGYDGLGL